MHWLCIFISSPIKFQFGVNVQQVLIKNIGLAHYLAVFMHSVVIFEIFTVGNDKIV